MRVKIKKLVTLAHLKDWKHETILENMARKTPQQNSYAELAFTVLVAKARAMLSAAQVPKDECHKLWGETVMTATVLDNLIPVTWKGETKTRYEHAGYIIPKYVKHLRTFGEAGIVKNMKDGKVGDRGITMMCVGYSSSHAGIATGCTLQSYQESVRHKTAFGWVGCTSQVRIARKQRCYQSLQFQSQMMCPTKA
jgi:hypothetical protein